jgi:hypothetical protein
LLDRLPRDGAGFAEVFRIESAGDLPAPEDRAIDVALLDMNCGYSNVGHEAIVSVLQDATSELGAELAHSGRHVRVLSYAVRDKLAVPEHGAGRHRLYVGTGGPGHLDPRRNTQERGTAQIREDPAWEAPLWALFDAIAGDDAAALYGVCHTFGLLCRWSGVAEPVLRGPEKGGPMSGIGTDVLTPQALVHPWFGRLAPLAKNGPVPVLESRYYDLLPSGPMPAGATPIAHESAAAGDTAGEALTMLEIARDGGGVPRVFAVNSHPEIGTPERIAEILTRMLAGGTIDREVYEARSAMLPMLRDDRRDERLFVGRAVFVDLVRERLGQLVRG